MPVAGFTMLRRQMGRALRNLRERAAVTEAQVHDERGLPSRTTLWRIETGKVAIKVGTVLALCRFYGADQQATEALANQAPGTDERGWWEAYGDIVPSWFDVYVGLESAATSISSYEGEVVPGELQTAAYTRAIYEAAQPDAGSEGIDRYVALRQERHDALLTRKAHLVAVLGEGVLTRQVGGHAVLVDQVDYLRQLNTHDHIEIRVLTWNAGAHVAMAGAFRILDFAGSDDPDVVYIEAHRGARYEEKPEDVEEYRRVFNTIYGQATPLEEYQK